MPKKPAPACRQPGCPRLAADNGFCSEDAIKQGAASYAARGSRRERGYPANWEKVRLHVLARDPYCKGCEAAISTEADHIKPLERGGSNHDDNLQGLCKPCHSIKTQLERGIFDPFKVMVELRAKRLVAAPLPPEDTL